MTVVVAVLLGATLLPPLVVLAVAGTLPVRGRIRGTILAASCVSLVAAVALLIAGSLFEYRDGGFDVVLVDGPGRGALLRVGLLSLPLFAMVSGLWVAGLAVAPARTFAVGPARRSAVAFLCIALAFSTTSPLALGALLAAGSAIFLAEHWANGEIRRVSGVYLGLSVASLLVGVVLYAAGGHDPVAAWITLGAVSIRKGIVPGHSWMPDSFEHGHLVSAVLFHGPQVGVYAFTVLVLPTAPGRALDVISVLALLTTLYAAILAVAENDARRAFGYLFMSESALVLAGMGTGDVEGVAGGLAVWIASALSMGGLGLTIAALELRRGRLSLAEHHGGYDQMPLLALSFLVLGLATVGFPGTLGFLGGELLVSGTVERFPAIGYIAVAATALNGITVLRMYFSLFCGRSSSGRLLLKARGREVAVFATLAVVLILGGLFPRGLVDSRLTAAHSVIDQRQAP